MPRFHPFTGLIFDPSVAGPLDRVTAPPYDVISEGRRRELLQAGPYGVVHLDLGEGSTEPSDPDSRYARAAAMLRRWEREGALRRTPEPCYFAYQMTVPEAAAAQGARSLSGLMCAMEVEPWGGTVLPHEEVREAPVQDRLALLRATRTHLSPVFGTIEGAHRAIAGALEEPTGQEALEAIDEEGVTHRSWMVPNDALDLRPLDGQRLLIADGHHRYTTAVAYRDERRHHEGAGPWDRVLTFVVDETAERLPVLAFHRLQLNGEPPELRGDTVADLDAVLRALDDDAAVVGFVHPGTHGTGAYRLLRLDAPPPAVRSLHRLVLDRLEPRAALRYEPDARSADAAVRRGDAVCAYLLPPTTPERIRDVVERGERLPAKSTYFWPKPRTGMVMMPLDRPGQDSPPRGDRAS